MISPLYVVFFVIVYTVVVNFIHFHLILHNYAVPIGSLRPSPSGRRCESVNSAKAKEQWFKDATVKRGDVKAKVQRCIGESAKLQR